MIAACVTAFFFGLLTLAVFLAKQLAKVETRENEQSKKLEEVDDANKIRDRLKSDDSFAKRVRDTFTRK